MILLIAYAATAVATTAPAACAIFLNGGMVVRVCVARANY